MFFTLRVVADQGSAGQPDTGADGCAHTGTADGCADQGAARSAAERRECLRLFLCWSTDHRRSQPWSSRSSSRNPMVIFLILSLCPSSYLCSVSWQTSGATEMPVWPVDQVVEMSILPRHRRRFSCNNCLTLENCGYGEAIEPIVLAGTFGKLVISPVIS